MVGRGVPVTLRAKAIQCLAQRDHSTQELRRKLLHHARVLRHQKDAFSAREQTSDGASAPSDDSDQAADLASEVEEVLSWLRDKNLLSDPQFAQRRAQSRAARYGNRRIEQELHQLGVELSDSDRLELQASEPERALQAWSKKFGTLGQTPQERAKQQRYLQQKGFSQKAVQWALKQASERLA